MELTTDHANQDWGSNITHKQVFDLWISSGKNEDEIIKLLMNFYPQANPSDEYQSSLKKYCHLLCLKIGKQWQKSNRTYDRFVKQNEDLLKSRLEFPFYVTDALRKEGDSEDSNPCRGRPLKRFEDCSVKTKKRRVEQLLQTTSPEELCFAASVSNTKKQFDINQSSTIQKSLTPEEALALSLDLDLTDRKYKLLRSVVNSMHKDCFPSIYAIRNTKKSYIPEFILTSEVSAKVDTQEILNKTVESISSLITLSKNTSATLVCKWGFGGSGNHSEYKQKFSNDTNTDEYLLLTAFVPLKLYDIETGEALWTNKYPGSTIYCRPLEFTFIKETPKIVTEQEAKIQNEIDNLVQYEIKVGNFTLSANFQFHLTMVDGSVCNILSNTNATSNCFICGAKPTEMNTSCNKLPNESNYRFGLSSLHGWIRCFECLIHISYRLSFKTWQVRSDEHKEIFKKEKGRIQSEFKSKMGLIVDKPKQGFGSSNDGNTARRFFANPPLSSEITGVDTNLIRKFGIILKLISSTRLINKDKFEELIGDTRELYLKLYRWYYMPSSVHKLLIHGADIMQFFPLPIGQMSEEAVEATHKVFRKTRLYHTRKTSRTSTCSDLIKRMILMSDPNIATKRNVERRHRNTVDSDNELDQYFVPSETECGDFSEVLENLELSSDDESD